jgi:hypothetical protein
MTHDGFRAALYVRARRGFCGCSPRTLDECMGGSPVSTRPPAVGLMRGRDVSTA